MRHRYGWVPDHPDHRDFLYRSIRPRGVLPQIVDLRPKCSEVEDQLALGSCTANALAGNLEFINKDFQASRLFIYFNERKAEGTVDQDSGAMLRDGIKTLAKYGVCSEYQWPYLISQFTYKPPQAAYDDAKTRVIQSYHRLLDINDMLGCLNEGFPFVFGFTVYENFESEEMAKTGVLSMPGAGERSLGGHAVLAVGFDQGKGVFIVRNSWGTAWGNSGYFTMPFEYAEKLAEDFWTVRK